MEGKNSLPVIYGINQKGPFAKRWQRGTILPEEVPAVARMLEQEGAAEFAQSQAQRLSSLALEALRAAQPRPEAAEGLTELVSKLLKREA